MVKAALEVEPEDLKMMREYLCRFQSMVIRFRTPGIDPPEVPYLQTLINEIDKHRPLGPNGKHGSFHTKTCGCDIRRCGNCLGVLPDSADRKCPSCRATFDIVPPIEERD